MSAYLTLSAVAKGDDHTQKIQLSCRKTFDIEVLMDSMMPIVSRRRRVLLPHEGQSDPLVRFYDELAEAIALVKDGDDTR